MARFDSENLLEIGRDYKKEDLEKIFNRSFGWGIKGISPGKWDKDTLFILLFSRGDGPYSDRIENNILYYDGEGEGKDQDFTRDNKLLAEANKNGRILYGFRKETKESQWKYLGILELLDYHYVRKGEFMKYEFRLRIPGISTTHDNRKEEFDINALSVSKIPQLTDQTKYTKTQKIARNKAFSDKIKRLYEFRCAVCGKQRFSNAQYPEVEAAHIFPKDKFGSDDLRNGIALCKLHHWAFDNGIFSLSDECRVIVEERVKNDTNYDEITRFEHESIKIPLNPELRPHQLFLKKHREIHGFERK